MLKKKARRIYNKKRQEISYTDRLKWDDLILINFQTIEMPFLQSVFSFYPMATSLSSPMATGTSGNFL